jgi:RNA recognition motif-containing protein
VTNSDLANLFEKIGRLKRCGLHWSENGLMKGTADVEYVYSEDARRALEEYNGKFNKIEFNKYLFIFFRQTTRRKNFDYYLG